MVNPGVGGGSGVTGNALGSLSAAVGDSQCLGTGNPALIYDQSSEGSGFCIRSPNIYCKEI